MNASTATIYRHAFDRDMDEATGEVGGNEWVDTWLGRRRAPEKWNWTVRLVQEWERAFFSTPTPRTRKIALRTSLVFSPAPGNVFAVLSRPGSRGSGRNAGQRPPVRLVDSRNRLCPRPRISHRP